jgi:hypothetical protein
MPSLPSPICQRIHVRALRSAINGHKVYPFDLDDDRGGYALASGAFVIVKM